VAGALRDVSLAVRAGEIVGVAGVEGNGQTELGLAVAGLVPVDAGRIRLHGVDVTRASPAERRRLGLAHVPEDRHRRGLLVDLALDENLLLGRDHSYARAGLIDRRALDADAARLVERFDVRPADVRARAGALSGGNQQKLVMARELDLAPRVLLAAQPTRGVDVGAIERIHAELDGLRRAGGAVLLVSAELDELLALADRICVLYRGRLMATVDRAAATRESLGALMTGAALARSDAHV
jgi:simple sugar transport system ATP-binding protein